MVLQVLLWRLRTISKYKNLVCVFQEVLRYYEERRRKTKREEKGQHKHVNRHYTVLTITSLRVAVKFGWRNKFKYLETTQAVLDLFLSSKFSTSFIPPHPLYETLHGIPIFIKEKNQLLWVKGGGELEALLKYQLGLSAPALSVPSLLTITPEAPWSNPLAPTTQTENQSIKCKNTKGLFTW